MDEGNANVSRRRDGQIRYCSGVIAISFMRLNEAGGATSSLPDTPATPAFLGRVVRGQIG